MGLERPARRAHLSRRQSCRRADDRHDQQPRELARAGLAAPHRGGVHLDRAAPRRVPRAAALLRPRHPRRLGEGLAMHEVTVGTKRLADYKAVIGDERYDELRALAAAAKGRSMVHINATAYGGGVAEILQDLIPLMRDAGVDAHWWVLDAPAEFFDVTKKLHNALQGMPLELSERERSLFLDVSRENAAAMPRADVVLAHDPQAVALHHFASTKAASWVWRCH